MTSHQRESPAGDTTHASPPARARVLVLDNHAPTLGEVAQLLQDEFTVTGLVFDADAAVERWQATRPHVIVIDIAVGSGGFETAALLRRVGCDAPFVFLSPREAPEIVRAAWNAGGLGVVARRDVRWDLVPAIRSVLCGRRYVSTAIQLR